jgi:Holliday junction DNA helicase RuvA
MIASLSGEVRSVSAGRIVLNVGGVGYLVLCTGRKTSGLSVGEKIDIETSYIVREDSATLYGFDSEQERELFDLLRSVTGVGPKSALAILNELDTESVALAVATEDDLAFKAVSGIGPKTAKLIVVTLAGKLGLKPQATAAGASKQKVDFQQQIIDALAGLGWPERVASDTVAGLTKAGSFESRDALLRASLAALGNSRK